MEVCWNRDKCFGTEQSRAINEIFRVDEFS